MRKVTALFNMTLDGVYDHTAGLPDKEIHQHYTALLRKGDVILYGKTTYQLMEFWRTLVEKPSHEESMNDFAVAIDKIPKIVFSHTLDKVDWKSASIASRTLKETLLQLKQQPGKEIYVGSRSLIIQLIRQHLIDELQLCVYPVIAGRGLQLFERLGDRYILKRTKIKTFKSGAVILYYELPTNP